MMNDKVTLPKLGLSGHIKWQVINPDGSIAQESEHKNLILDQGLDQVASSRFAELFYYCAVGTGQTAPVVGDTGLIAEVARTNNYITNPAGECGTTVTGAVVDLKRTFQFPAGLLDGTYYEVGFAESSTPGANLFSRALFSITGAPVGVAVTAVQELRVVYTLTVTLAPAAPTAGSLAITGMAGSPFAYTAMVQSVYGNGITPNQVSTYGTTPIGGVKQDGLVTAADYNRYRSLEPSGPNNWICGAYTTNTPLAAVDTFNSVVVLSSPQIYASTVNNPYTPGSFIRDITFTFTVNDAVDTLYGFFIGGQSQANSAPNDYTKNHSYRLLFDAPITKANTHELVLPLRLSWGRV